MKIILFLLFGLVTYVTSYDAKIVIIGAGSSGFAAASRLLENGFKNVTILEAKNRIGGRVNTVEFADNIIEMGAEWVHGMENNVVFELASPHDLLLSEDIFANYTFIDAKGEIVPSNEGNTVMDLWEEISDEMENSTNKIAAGTSVGKHSSTRFREAFRKAPFTTDERLEEFLIIMEKMSSSLSSSDTWDDVSAKRVAGYRECEGSQEVTWKKNGYKTLFDILQRKFSNETEKLNVVDNIDFEKELESIDYTNPDEIIVKTSDGTKYTAKHVIFTPSLGVLKHKHSTMFNPSLPEPKQRAIEGLEFGNVLKIFLEFPQSWWPDDVYEYDLLWSKKEREEFVATQGKDKEWLCDVIYFSPVVNQPRVLAGWSVGKSARFSETISDEQMMDDVHFLLKKFLQKIINKDIPKPSKIMRSKWFGDKHTRGTYSYDSLKSEQMNATRKDLAEPITTESGKPVILFAGEATNENRYSTVDGAVESGFREADRLYNYYKSATK